MDRLHHVDRRGLRAACASSKPDGTGARDVVTTPGHYIEPSFSPDGKLIVFRNAGADGIRGRLYGADAGIYVVPADGSAAPRARPRERIAADVRPHRQADLPVRSPRREVRALQRRASAIRRRRCRRGTKSFTSSPTTPTQIVPSPDGKWVAFEERFHDVRRPVPAHRAPGGSRPDRQAYPTSRVSRDAGSYLHWSGDSRRVFWSLGPELFTRDLGRTFTFLDREP